MRGDQLTRQWRVIRAIKAGSKGLIVAEIPDREETRKEKTICRNLGSFLAGKFPLYTKQINPAYLCDHKNTFKFKIRTFLELTALQSSVPCGQWLTASIGTQFVNRLKVRFPDSQIELIKKNPKIDI